MELVGSHNVFQVHEGSTLGGAAGDSSLGCWRGMGSWGTASGQTAEQASRILAGAIASGG